MKKNILTLFAVAIASASMLAQESHGGGSKKTPEERTEKMTARLTSELSLTSDQQAKIKPVILKHEQARAAAGGKEDQTEKDQYDASIKSILTPEQYQTYQQKKAEMKEHHQGH